jgi:multiple sugar transport system substrate-binding protein
MRTGISTFRAGAAATLILVAASITGWSSAAGYSAGHPVAQASQSPGESSQPTACSSQPSGDQKTVTMWARGADQGFLPDLVQQFNCENPGINLELTLIPDPQVFQKYSTAAASGSGPDIVAVAIDQLPQYLSSGWLQDITADVNALPYKDTLSPAHLSQGTVDGKNYNVPLTADVSLLYWNKDLFQQAGLDPEKAPATWDEIRSDAQAVRRLGGDDYGYFFSGGCAGCLGFTMVPFTWANGGDIFKEDDAGNVQVALSPNPELQSTLEFYRQLWQDGVVPDTAKTENGSDQFSAFFSGKIGMFVQGTYPFSQLIENYPDINFGITPVPSTDGSATASFAGGDGLSLTTQADHDTGMTVLKWFMDQGQQTLAKKGILPIRSDIANQYYVPLDPRNAAFVKALEVGHTPKFLKLSPFFDTNGPFAGLIQSAIFGDGSIPDAMDSAQAAASTLNP